MYEKVITQTYRGPGQGRGRTFISACTEVPLAHTKWKHRVGTLCPFWSVHYFPDSPRLRLAPKPLLQMQLFCRWKNCSSRHCQSRYRERNFPALVSSSSANAHTQVLRCLTMTQVWSPSPQNRSSAGGSAAVRAKCSARDAQPFHRAPLPRAVRVSSDCQKQHYGSDAVTHHS